MDHAKNDSPLDAAARRHVLKLVSVRHAQAVRAKARRVSGWQAVADELGVSRGALHHIAHGRMSVPAEIADLVILRRAFSRAGRMLGRRRRSILRGES